MSIACDARVNGTVSEQTFLPISKCFVPNKTREIFHMRHGNSERKGTGGLE